MLYIMHLVRQNPYADIVVGVGVIIFVLIDVGFIITIISFAAQVQVKFKLVSVF